MDQIKREARAYRARVDLVDGIRDAVAFIITIGSITVMAVLDLL